MRPTTFRTFWLPVLLMTLIAAFFGAVLAHRGGDWDKLQAEKATLQTQLSRTGGAERPPEGAARRAAQLPRGHREGGAGGLRLRSDRREGGDGQPPRPSGGALPAPAPAEGKFPALVWGRMLIMLPLAVFVVTAFVFALMNILSGAGMGAKESQ